MKGRALAIKRINKDLKEITKFPVEGIGIASLDNDPMKYIVNIRLMAGIYTGYCVQLLLTFPDNYPSKPPKILIYPGQAIDGNYHHHIFPDFSLKDEFGLRFKRFCFDLLDNDFMSTTKENSGWNPSYSISSLLLQVQNFIGDPDLPKDHLPDEKKIEELMKSMDTYEREFKVYEENENKFIIIKHTWKNPYPEMYMKKNDKNENKKIDKKKKEEEIRIQQIRENLICFMLKLNYIDDPEILLGYPIIQKKGKGKDKIELFPIPELLTYDGFIAQIQKQEDKLDFYFDTKFKSANNRFYNYWMPIYIDERHYSKNKTTILNALSVIKYGPSGLKKYDFQTDQIFEILPIILNKMIIGMFNGQSIISSAFIMCYFHYILLFRKLCIEYEDEYKKYVNHKLNLIHKNKYNIRKKIIPDIGNFLVLLYFGPKKTNNKLMEKMWDSLYEEFLLRQIFWMFYNEGKGDKILDKIFLSDDEIIGYSSKKNELKREALKSGFLKVNNHDKFLELLNKENIYDKIIEIINKEDESSIMGLSTKKAKSNKKKLLYDLNKNFNAFFDLLESNKKPKVIDLLIDKEEFYDFFELSDTYIKKHKIPPKIERVLKIRKLLYNNDKISEEITNSFLKYAYEEQIGNKLLLITYIAKKKIEEEGFMETLEKNYGVYLDVDNFVKEMKKTLSEIKSHSQLFNYIGSQFGCIDNLELIREAYEKAKSKRYVENDKKKKKKEKKESDNKEKKEKKATVNFDDDEEEAYIEDYNENDEYYEDDEEEEEEEDD